MLYNNREVSPVRAGIEEPHYKRIRRQIEMQIRRGELTPGHRLPGERDLATQFGVSQMTANRALMELVKDGWLERRVGAGTFVSRREAVAPVTLERTLVLVTPFADHPAEDVYLQTPFRGLSERATREGCALLVTHSPETGFVQVIDRYPHAGYVFVAPNDDSLALLTQLHSQHVPFVVLGASWPNAPFACVDSNNVYGACAAVDYLVRLGHRRIACINGVAEAANCRDRVAGYHAAMNDHGIAVDPDWMIDTGSNLELGSACRRQLTDLILRREPITAVVSAGFSLTMSLLELARTLQLRLPADLSIISFDDPPVAAHLSPPLTTIAQPLAAMGARAFERITAIMTQAGPDGPSVELLPTNIVVRGSCERIG